MVPSIAIREGVYKSLQITEEHFAALYDNAPCRYFIYNSAKLSDVRTFAASANIEIMIINIDAFRKAENVINQQQDRLNGEAAIRYIQDTSPIVIIDEPQSVDNTQMAKDAIASLHPLCVFRYPATHREKVNLLYRLTPVDAYQMGLVKQICVSSDQVMGGFNRPYIRLLSVSHENGFRARIELDVKGKDGHASRKPVNVRQGSNLYKLSGGGNCTRAMSCNKSTALQAESGLNLLTPRFCHLEKPSETLTRMLSNGLRFAGQSRRIWTKNCVIRERALKYCPCFSSTR